MELQDIFNNQKEIKGLLKNPPALHELSLFTIGEIVSMLELIDWKKLDPIKKTTSKRQLAIEIADILKYVMQMAVEAGLTCHDVETALFQKHATVVKMVRSQNKELKDDIIAIDIDGILAEYKKGMAEYFGQRLGKKIELDRLSGSDIKSEIIDLTGITIEQYYEIKRDYRTGGMKATLEPIKEAIEFVNKLNKDHSIILVSNRPAKKYNTVMVDTYVWLIINGVKFDRLLFGDDKLEKLIEYGKKIKCFVEDDLHNAKEISRLGIPVYLLDSPATRYEVLGERITLFSNYNHIYEQISRATQ